MRQKVQIASCGYSTAWTEVYRIRTGEFSHQKRPNGDDRDKADHSEKAQAPASILKISEIALITVITVKFFAYLSCGNRVFLSGSIPVPDGESKHE